MRLFPSVTPVVAVASAALTLAACLAGDAVSTEPPGAAPPRAEVEPTATRTTVTLGPGSVLVTEIVQVGPDARATSRSVAGPVGEEVRIGDQHYVRFLAPEAAELIGGDVWIHTDLSDPRQRAVAGTYAIGLIELATLSDTVAGETVSGQEVVAVDRSEPGVVVIDFGHGTTLRLETEVLDGSHAIDVPTRPEVVDLPDLPRWRERI